MNGCVDGTGGALIRIAVKSLEKSAPTHLDAWIDTGFTGELSLPAPVIVKLGLSQAGLMDVELGDGSHVAMKTYGCFVEWFGETRRVEVVASRGDHPLLGIGLLR